VTWQALQYNFPKEIDKASFGNSFTRDSGWTRFAVVDGPPATLDFFPWGLLLLLMDRFLAMAADSATGKTLRSRSESSSDEAETSDISC